MSQDIGIGRRAAYLSARCKRMHRPVSGSADATFLILAMVGGFRFRTHSGQAAGIYCP